MYAEFEPLAYVLRVWEDGKEYPDEYFWSAAVVHISREGIEIKGVVADLPLSKWKKIWRAVKEECIRKNIEEVLITRIKDGQIVKNWRKVNK